MVRVLTHQAGNDGYTRVVFDSAIDKRPTLVLYTEHAASVLETRPGEWFHELVPIYRQRSEHFK